MSEAKTADAPPSGDILERGLLIGGKSVPASSTESFTEQRWVTIQHTSRPAYPF